MLRRAFLVLVFLLPAASAFAQAPAPPPATMRVAFIEVGPADVGRATAALKDYRQATLKANGIVRVNVLQQIDRANQFAIEEAWRDAAALEAHKSAAETKKLDEAIQAMRISPVDERLLAAVNVVAPKATTPPQAVYVITHADSVPERRVEAGGVLTDLAAKSRQEAGNLIFDVDVQTNRINHFTVVEAWRDQKAYEAHITAENTRKFRDTFQPFLGAWFDDRIYKSL